MTISRHSVYERLTLGYIKQMTIHIHCVFGELPKDVVLTDNSCRKQTQILRNVYISA